MLQAMTDHYKPLLTTVSHYWCYTDQYEPLLTATNCYWLLQAVTDCYKPLVILQAITDGYKPLLILQAITSLLGCLATIDDLGTKLEWPCLTWLSFFFCLHPVCVCVCVQILLSSALGFCSVHVEQETCYPVRKVLHLCHSFLCVCFLFLFFMRACFNYSSTTH